MSGIMINNAPRLSGAFFVGRVLEAARKRARSAHAIRFSNNHQTKRLATESPQMSDLSFRRRRDHLEPQAEGFRLGATETAETIEKEHVMASTSDNPGRIASIVQSYDGLPTWVKIWMNFVLGPINLATLFFLNEPSGGLIAALAIGGMVLTVALVVANAGFEKIVAAGHVLPWVPLVALLAIARPDGSELYQTFLVVLLIANSISLLFDFNDVRVALSSRKAPA